MNAGDEEDRALRSVAMQNAQSILLARQRAEQQLVEAKGALEHKTGELARSVSVVRATLDSTWDGILVTDDRGRITAHNEMFIRMWMGVGSAVATGDHRAVLNAIATEFADAPRFVARVDEILADAPAESFDVLSLRDGRMFERFSKRLLVDDRAVGRVWSFRDITQRRNAESALQDETRMLELLNHTGKKIAAELDLPVLLQSVIDAATELIGARYGVVALNTASAHRDAFVPLAAAGIAPADFDTFSREEVASPFALVADGGPTIRCRDVRADERWGATGADLGLPGPLAVQSYLAVPLTSRSGKAIGGLFFGHPDAARFAERSERLVLGVAAQAGVAIDNARLYETAQKAADERKELLDRERTARGHAERLSATKDEFLATLSHELRTPLTSILGWAHVLRHGTGSRDDVKKGLEVIERNARAQTQLIEDLLDMSRITSGKVRLDIQPVQPISFIEAAIETVRPAAEARGVRIEKVLDPVAGPISGDTARLQQVVWNLLSNAIKFTPRDGCVKVVAERVNSSVEISVADTGIGIAPDFLAHVFDRFRQADHSTTREFGGLGLGLSIVKHLVELHGGSVRARSRGEGSGATFTVQLPVTAVAAIGGVARAHAAAETVVPPEFRLVDLSGVKVLIVDDEADARGLVERLLADCKAEVLTAPTAERALAAVERERPDVLLSDIGMPGMDGYELLRRIRALGEARGGKLPAIALTAFARSEDRTRALRAGFQVHVSKPIEPAELIATVASIVGRMGSPE